VHKCTQTDRKPGRRACRYWEFNSPFFKHFFVNSLAISILNEIVNPTIHLRKQSDCKLNTWNKMAVIPQRNELLQQLEHSFECFTLQFNVLFHTVSEFFLKKWRGTAANLSWIFCSVPSNILAFDQQTLCLDQLNNKKSQVLISGLCRSNLRGSGPTFRAPGRSLPNDDWNVKT